VTAALSLYLRFISVSLRAQMQYRASFVMMVLGQFLYYAVRFFGIWIIFGRFDHIGGWSLHEVALLYGIVHIAVALAEATSPGFRNFGTMVKDGDFDRLLLRPRGTVLQLAARSLQLTAIGPLIQGIGVFIWAAHSLDISWTLAKIILLLTSVAGGVLLYYGLAIFEAAMVFWTTQSLEFRNSITRGGLAAAQYPIAIYKKWLRNFFTYFVPLAFVNYYPALFILERTDELGRFAALLYFSPLFSFLFFSSAYRCGILA
jgi:ABC-2 type transport system permease protein